MSISGGNYTLQNKVLPGAYINFVTTKRGGSIFGERGTGAIAMCLNWGNREEPIVVEKDEIRACCKKYFGYDYNDDSMITIREFFRHGKKLIVYRLNDGTTASCSVATAIYSGVRGNDLSVVVSKNVDNSAVFDVETYFDGELVDSQTVSTTGSLVNNDYVCWNKSFTLAVGTYSLSGGSSKGVTGSGITGFCNKMENYSFNAITVITDDSDAEDVLVEFTKRMRDERGIKFQCVVRNTCPDYEGAVSLYNYESGNMFDICNAAAWVCGAIASCEINESLTNIVYDGELDILPCSLSYLERFIKMGYFIFYKDDDELRVLRDVNSLVSISEEKGEAMQNNQTIRVCDQIAMDVAATFSKYYLGKVPNDRTGRNALWNDLVTYHEKLVDLRAIEDFEEDDIEVLEGDSKNSVVVNESIMPVNAMEKLYMKVYIE